MENYKIHFPIGYLDTNIMNDNIDVNIIFEAGEKYFGTLTTLDNIKSFLDKGDVYFWCTNMLIVKDLRKETIELAIKETINDGYFMRIFDKIGALSNKETFSEIIHMNDLA